MTEISQSVSAAFGNADGKPSLNPRTNIVSDTVSSGVTFTTILKTTDVDASITNDDSQISVEDGESSSPFSAVEDEIPPEPEEQMTLLIEDPPTNHRPINVAAESDPQIQHHDRATDSEIFALGTDTSLKKINFQSDKDTEGLNKTDSAALKATGLQASTREPTDRHEMQLARQTQNPTFGSTLARETMVSTAPLKGSPETFDNVEKSKQGELSQAVIAKHTKLSKANVEEPPVPRSVEKSKDASISGISSWRHGDQAQSTSNLPTSPPNNLRLDRNLTDQARQNHPDMLADRAVHTAAGSIDQKLGAQSLRPQKLFDVIGDVEQKIHPERALQLETTPRLNSGSPVIPGQSASGSSQAEARFIAHQLGAHLSNQKDRTTTIRLSPEELGQVRMTLRTSETGLTLAISAERPETSEMMRRNIDVLAQEFQSLGFENLNFQFSDEASDKNTEPPIDHTSIDEGDTPQQLGSAPQHKAGQNGRLDMRI